MWMFNLILKQVRYHRPSTILLSYDFSLVSAHNHIYDLKSNVFGYFLSMLSLISNHHTILIINTSDMNHVFPNKCYSESNAFKLFSCNGKFSIRNYLSNAKAEKRLTNSNRLTWNTYPEGMTEEELKKQTQPQTMDT